MDWYRTSADKALAELDSQERGLPEAEAAGRLLSHGRNELAQAKPDSAARILLRQFESPIIYVLLAAAAAMLAMGHANDAAIILIVLAINAVIGAVQEGRAQNTLAALKRMVKTDATVVRDGAETIVPSEEVVPGDVISLKEGDKVPADARVMQSESLRVDEAALTGESEPASKSPDPIDKEGVPPQDQKNMVFKGTYVVGGECRAVVVATGARTVIGGISEKLSSLETDMPLKEELKALSRVVIYVVLGVCALIFLIGVLHRVSVAEMFLTAVAVAVSAIPEGLPVVVTIVLAAGVYRMSKKNALVRKLQAVEALGQARIVAVDKTGTVTLNQMMVEKVYVDGETYDVSGQGYEPKGSVSRGGEPVSPPDHETLLLAGRISSLTASAAIAFSKERQEWERVSGDPTEVALLAFSEKLGFAKDALLAERPKVFEIPFSSSIKYHASAHEVGDKIELYVAGAPEVILAKTSSIKKAGKLERMGEDDRKGVQSALLSLSRLGLRVMALAAKFDSERSIDPGSLPDLAFVGLVGISDSVRLGARDALLAARKAGVKVVMITGDYPETAKAIAAKVGIFEEGDTVVTGEMLSTLPQAELTAALSKASVFARVAPEDKLRIIEAYRSRGEVVAMTGDGVNDALSLAAADLGVSMGKIGTEVAKEASDIVLLDDNFGSIVSAIEEGRNIYRTIRKVVLYLFSTNIGEMLTIVSAMLLGLPVPLLAGQIIWLNFVTDTFLVIGLALDPRDKDLLKPIRKRASVIDKTMFQRMAVVSVAMTACALVLFAAYIDEGFVKASTVTLTALAVCQWWNAWNVRSETRSAFSREAPRNPYLIAALALVAGLQLLAVYWGPLQSLLGTTALAAKDWYLILGFSLSVIAVEEIRKLLARRPLPASRRP